MSKPSRFPEASPLCLTQPRVREVLGVATPRRRSARVGPFALVLAVLAAAVNPGCGSNKPSAGGINMPAPSGTGITMPDAGNPRDWITREGFQGMYVYVNESANPKGMRLFRERGINSLIIHLMGSENASQEGYPMACDAWKPIKDETGLKLFMSITFGSDERYGNTEFGEWVGEAGNTINAPCPASAPYWEKVYGNRGKIAAERGFDGALVDVEMYAADQTRFPGPCFCDACWAAFAAQVLTPGASTIAVIQRGPLLDAGNLRAAYAHFQEATLAKILTAIRMDIHAQYPEFMLGNLLYYEEIAGLTAGLGTPRVPALVLDEYSYDGLTDRHYNYLESVSSDGHRALIIPGLAPTKLTPAQFPEKVNELYSISYQNDRMGGFWFWQSHAFLMDHPPQGYERLSGYTANEYLDALGKIEYPPILQAL